MNYADDLRINESQLDIEWLEQPIKFAKYCQLSAAANDRLRKAEEKVKMVRSELVLDAKQKGDKVLGAGLKPTADVIEAYYRQHPEHIAAKDAYNEAAYEAEILNNAMFAFQQRKLALENLVRLQAQNYFAAPTEPRDLPAEYKNHRQEALRDTEQSQTTERVAEVRRSRRSRSPE